MASALPNRRSSPSVSALVRIPFSKHSMAQAIVIPTEMVSITYSPQIWWNLAMAPRSPTPQTDPPEPMVSYSGPPYFDVTPRSGTSTSRLQAMAHA